MSYEYSKEWPKNEQISTDNQKSAYKYAFPTMAGCVLFTLSTLQATEIFAFAGATVTEQVHEIWRISLNSIIFYAKQCFPKYLDRQCSSGRHICMIFSLNSRFFDSSKRTTELNYFQIGTTSILGSNTHNYTTLTQNPHIRKRDLHITHYLLVKCVRAFWIISPKSLCIIKKKNS